MRIVGAVLTLATLLVALASSSAEARRTDFAATAFDILAPGENGGVAFNRNTDDEAKLYDALTPLEGRVTRADLERYFKPEWLGTRGQGPTRVENVGLAGVGVVRDRFGVAHITGRTRAATMYAEGWVTAEDRGLLMELLRNAGPLAALDAPGFDAFSVALTGRRFVPSAATEQLLSAQIDLLRQSGARGRRLLADLDAFVIGINAYYRSRGLGVAPWRPSDVVSVGALLAARFAADGGGELRRSEFLAQLEQRLGQARGSAVFRDLAELDDPDAPVTAPGSFPYELRADPAPGSVLLVPGSFTPAGRSASTVATNRWAMSNTLLVGAKRSATGHPLLVAGPQLGYFFPEVFLEVDVHGPGIDERGGTVPGIPYVIIGRGPDFAWSATSPRSDNVDDFAEALCGGDDLHYLYKGECRAMTPFDAGVLKGSAGTPDTPVVFHQTVHGPVIGYATTTAGERVAIAQERSTRGRELLSLLPLEALAGARRMSARAFIHTMSGFELTLNWFYADDRDVAYYSSGRLPRRAAGTDPSLPTVGTGEYDWQGFLSERDHPQTIDPPSGLILNWNTKQARGFGTADTNWSYGSVQRVQLLADALGARRKISPVQLVDAMNKAATQDLRVMRVWPAISAVLRTGPAPSPRAAKMAALLDAWRAHGGSRLDRNLDGNIDDPGAAIMDAGWYRLARAVLTPVLGSLVDQLGRLETVSDDANSQGSSYLDGWYGYVDKDLRTLLGRKVLAPFSTLYCGNGDLAACRASLWAALDEAGAELQALQGPDPTRWRASATGERIAFLPGILSDTMRWTNRPTFQQVVTFDGHR